MMERIVFFVIFVLFSLTSCSTTRREVSPVPPDKSYAVASWYGKDFHGRPTSSGEIYDMHANTCAHKAFPFGTKLKVTHLSNNKSVECIVNDRGPFIEGRDIDLSYAVAKEIGVVGPGISKVLLEVNGRDTSYIRKVRVQAADRKGVFSIQAGAFTESSNAIRLRDALNLKYENVYIQQAEVGGTMFHRVRIGNFRDFERALSLAEQLGQEGYRAVIVKADMRI